MVLRPGQPDVAVAEVFEASGTSRDAAGQG